MSTIGTVVVVVSGLAGLALLILGGLLTLDEFGQPIAGLKPYTGLKMVALGGACVTPCLMATDQLMVFAIVMGLMTILAKCLMLLEERYEAHGEHPWL